MTRPPRRPTPITVAAVLLIVAASAVQALAVAVDLALTGVPLFLTFPVLLPCGFLLLTAVALLHAKLTGVIGLAGWLTWLGILTATPAVVGLMCGIEAAFTVGGLSSGGSLPLGAVVLVLTASVAVVVAASALHVHADDYRRWRDERRRWEADNSWELVQDADGRRPSAQDEEC